MVTKKIVKKKTAANAVSQQYVLFDEQGFKPFHPLTDAIPVAPDEGKYEIGAMRVQLIPVPKELDWALKLVTDNLVLLQMGAKQWIDCDEGSAMSFYLDSWTCAKCSVIFRTSDDKGVIRATYMSRDDRLDLSLPRSSSWENYGLGWLLKRDRCCARGVHNPTPWLGKQCGCK